MLPREKLKKFGPSKLEDHELMSLLICRGNKKETVFDISKRLLKNFDKEEIINEVNPEKFKKSLNIGEVQASQIIASIELGKRFFKKTSSEISIRSTNDVYEIVRNMENLKKEYLRGLYLNTRYKVIHDEIISIGSLDSSILHPRDVFRPAIEYNSYGVILVHNHPSGESSPSSADIDTTKNIVKVGSLIQIPILDHIIVGKGSYFSMQQNNLINS